ncbi:MAG: hypothetical protein ABW073_07055, partial [Acidimicrobiia bacterium]
MRLADGASDWVEAAPVFDGRTISPFAAQSVGRFVAVLGGPKPSAVLDVMKGSWHRMPSPPHLVGTRGSGAWWTGTELLGLQAGRGGRLAVAIYRPGP